ncbi:hypothetical protein BDZ91DRAFT_744739, partial [Kalaharituber pfeilii]
MSFVPMRWRQRPPLRQHVLRHQFILIDACKLDLPWAPVHLCCRLPRSLARISGRHDMVSPPALHDRVAGKQIRVSADGHCRGKDICGV